MDKLRLDQLLVLNKLSNSRSKARVLVESDNVKVDGVICNDVSKKFLQNVKIEILNNIKYVSRGGEKLEGAVHFFNIIIKDKVCIDVGSSTGGFTDYLIQNGAAHVTAIDVGSAQFDRSLLEKNQDKINLFEKTDIRNFKSNTEYDLLVCDLSFISLENILEDIKRLLKIGGEGVLLIKPQFEVGKGNTKKGVVKSDELISEVLEKYKNIFTQNNFEVMGVCDSPIRGGDGNREYFIYIKK